MATTVGFSCTPGLGATLTLELYPLDSDTATTTAAATEGTNALGWYTATITAASATYRLRVKDGSNNTRGTGVLNHDASAVSENADVPSAVPTAAQIWANATRTLTMSAAQIAAIVDGSDLALQRGDTLVIALTGLGNITTRTKLWFALKDHRNDADSEAQLIVEETAGLQVVAGGTPVTGDTATLVVTNATTGAATITISAQASMKLAEAKRAVWDMQMTTAAGVVTTLTQGDATVVSDVTRRIT